MPPIQAANARDGADKAQNIPLIAAASGIIHRNVDRECAIRKDWVDCNEWAGSQRFQHSNHSDEVWCPSESLEQVTIDATFDWSQSIKTIMYVKRNDLSSVIDIKTNT